MEKVLIQYKRNNKNELKGVVVSIGRGIVGWSLCHKNDIFSKEEGRDLAIKRALKLQHLQSQGLESGNMEAFNSYKEKFTNRIPQTMESTFEEMSHRSEIYFKQ